MAFEVQTKAFRDALTAVLPLVGDQDHFDRVRLEVSDSDVTISATNGRQAGAAILPITDWHQDSAGLVFDLEGAHVKKLLAVHVLPPKSDGHTDDDLRVLVEVVDSGTALRTQDTSGLFPGQEALVVPLCPPSDLAPDIVGFLGRSAHAYASLWVKPKGVAFNGDPLITSFSAFDKAVKTYREPMVVRVAKNGSSFLVTVGESFIGTTTAHNVTKATGYGDDLIAQAWEQWLLVLPSDHRDIAVTGPDQDSAPSSSADPAPSAAAADDVQAGKHLQSV